MRRRLCTWASVERGASLVAPWQRISVPLREIWVQSLGQGDPEKEVATTLAFLPGKSHGQRSLVGHSPWDHKESDATEQLNSNNNNLWKEGGNMGGADWVWHQNSWRERVWRQGDVSLRDSTSERPWPCGRQSRGSCGGLNLTLATHEFTAMRNLGDITQARNLGQLSPGP